MSNYNKLLNNFEKLKLDKIKQLYPNYIETITKGDFTLTDALYELTEKEIEYRDERASQIQITVSAFPYKKEIEDFDFSYQPSINKNEDREKRVRNCERSANTFIKLLINIKMRFPVIKNLILFVSYLFCSIFMYRDLCYSVTFLLF